MVILEETGGAGAAFAGVEGAVPTVSATLIGADDVGCTCEGKKLQVAPTGKPLHVSMTGSANGPLADTWNVAALDGFGTLAVTVAGIGALIVKFTTFKTTAWSLVNVPSVP